MMTRTEAAFMVAAEAETMPREQLKTLQLERLRDTLSRAYACVPHYHRSFNAAGVKPEDMRHLEDLARFPFIVKADLRDNYPFGLFAVPRDQVIRVHASSGTTGKPTVVGYTEADIAVWGELVARGLAAYGVRPGDVLHNAYGYGLFTGGLGAHYGAEHLKCSVVPMSGGNTEKQVVLLRDFGARVLCCTPSYALNIAEVAEQMEMSLADSALAIGVFGAEPWTETMRAELDRRLGIRAHDIYGLSEIMGPGVAAECDRRDGLHGWEDHFLFEVVDPDTLQPLPLGAQGELVITTLTKQALPMIRYRTRDITTLSAEPCACGRTHVRIKRITGRNDDMMIIRGVNVYPSQIEAVLVGAEGLSPHYLLTLSRQGALDHLTVEVEAEQSESEEGRSHLGAQLRHHIKSLIGVTCEVMVRLPGELPRSMGKAVRVRDLRKDGT